MGVRGLLTFLEEENGTAQIRIDYKIKMWRKCNPNREPIVVIDFLSFCNSISRKNFEDIICGGRHHLVSKKWENILVALKEIGCKLICFSDLHIPQDKIHKKLNSQDVGHGATIKLYNAFINGKIDLNSLPEGIPRIPLKTVIFGMAAVARDKCNEFYHSVKHEADLEIARYAQKHDVMAIFSSDTDFLIFGGGSWSLWSTNNIYFTRNNRLATIEYNRNIIEQILSLSTYQLPLFATLMGNDVINFKGIGKIFHRYFRIIGLSQNRIRNIAQYVLEKTCGMDDFTNLSKDNLRRIFEPILDDSYNEWEDLIRRSIDSYNTSIPTVCKVNSSCGSMEQKLLGTDVYRSYMLCMNFIHEQHMPFYDFRGCDEEMTLPNLLTDWIKRRRGVIVNAAENTSPTFTLLIIKDANKKAKAYTETPIYPDFEIPPLDELYLGRNDVEHLNEMRWKLFGWMMSFDDGIIAAIRRLPKRFLLISSTLYVLVKNRLISAKSADGILYTEYKVITENEVPNISRPYKVVDEYVRAAHLYNITFSALRENFAIAGLLSMIEDVMQFDGVYFQRLMELTKNWNDKECQILYRPIQMYRI